MASTIWNREDLRFSAHQVSSRTQHSPSKHLQMWYYAGFEGGGCLCVIPCTAVQYCSTWHIVLSLSRELCCYTKNRVVFDSSSCIS